MISAKQARADSAKRLLEIQAEEEEQARLAKVERQARKEQIRESVGPSMMVEIEAVIQAAIHECQHVCTFEFPNDSTAELRAEIAEEELCKLGYRVSHRPDWTEETQVIKLRINWEPSVFAEYGALMAPKVSEVSQ